MATASVTIRNESGFHVRPAQLFSETAGTYQSTVMVHPQGTDARIDGKSILGLMTLGLAKGDVVTITTEGPDEAEALQTLSKLVEDGFGEV
jgi:phosphocarrier protein HPr